MASFDALDFEEKPTEGAVSYGDYARTLGAGAAGVGSNLAAASRYFYEQGKSENGAKISQALQDLFGIGRDTLEEGMGDEAKKRVSAAVTSAEFWEHPGSAAALKLTNMSPMLAAAIVPGGLMSEALGATIATAGAGGVLNAGSVIDEIYKKTDALDDSSLQEQSSYYAGLRASGMDEKQARAAFNAKRQGLAPAINFVVGAAANAIGPAAGVARGLVGGPGALATGEAGLVGRTLAGAAEGAGGMAAQGAVAEATTQAADTDAETLNQPFDPAKVMHAALEGTAAGALLGGAAGAAFKGLKVGDKRPRIDSPAAEAEFTNKGMKITGETPAEPPASQPVPQVHNGTTGVASKPVDDPAQVGNPQNAPVRGSRAGGKKPPPAEGDPVIDVVAGAAPNAEQLAAIKSNEMPANVAPTEVAAASDRLGKITKIEPENTPGVTTTSQTPELARTPVAKPEITPEVTQPPVSPVSEVPAAEPAQAAAPPVVPTPVRSGRVLPNLSEEAKGYAKAQNAALKANIKSIEPPAPKGKNLTKAEKEGIATRTAVAEKIYNDHAPPAEGETNYTTVVPDRDAVAARAVRMVKDAEDAGVKIPTRVKVSTKGDQASDSPHVQMLVYARDLAKVAAQRVTGKKLTDAVKRFKEREDAVRSGGHEEALAARKAEGDQAMRRDQGDVEESAGGSSAADMHAETPEEALIRKQEGDGDSEPAEVAAEPVRAVPSAPKPKTPVVTERVERARQAARILAEAREKESTPAPAVRKVTATAEEKAAMIARLNEAAKKSDARSEALKDHDAREAARPEVRLREAAKEVDRNPTDAQKDAGNYQKGHVKLHGLDIAIENPRGGNRSGVGADGEPWSVRMPDHYGYIKRTSGADGDHVDTYIGKHPESSRAFVVDQLDTNTGQFDEHKVMLAYRTEGDALDAYRRAFSDGKGLARAGNIHELSINELKDWLNTADTTKPVTEHVFGDIVHAGQEKSQLVRAERTTPAREVLAKIDFSHLDEIGGAAPAMQPFIKRRLMELVGDTPVHFVSDRDMGRLLGENFRENEAPHGVFVNRGDARGEIYINSRNRGDQKEIVQTILHEATHRALDLEIQGSKVAKEHIDLMMETAWKAINAFGDVQKEFFLSRVSNAFKNEFEFMAEAFSNPELQNVLATIPAPERLVSELKLDVNRGPASIWDAMLRMARRAIEKLVGPIPHSESLLNAAMRSGENLVNMRRKTMRDLGIGEERVPARDFAAARMRETEGSVLDAVKEYVSGPERQTMENAPKLLKWRTLDNIAQMGDHFFGENNPVRTIQEAVEATRVSAQRELKKTEPTIQKLYDLQQKYRGKGWDNLASVLHDATMANVHPDVPLTDVKNSYLGKNRLDAVQSKARHAELSKRFDALPEELKAGYHQAVKFFTDQQNKLAFETLNNRVLKLMGIEDEALARRVFENKTTDADVASLGELLPLLQDAKELSKIDGPYVPLMRRGDHVVVALHDVTTPSNAKAVGDGNTYEFGSRKEAEDFARSLDVKADVKSVWVDKTTGSLYGDSNGKPIKIHKQDVDAENRYHVDVQNKHVEFVNGKKAAEVLAADLAKQGLKIRTVEPRKPDNFSSGEFNSQAMQSIIAQIKKRENYKNATPQQREDILQALNEASVQMLGSTRIQAKHLPRRYVEGASRDLVQNAYDYSASTARSLAKLEHAPQLEAGAKSLETAVEQDQSKTKNYARRAISNEVNSRLKAANMFEEETKYSAATKRLLAVSFLDKLASPAYSVINAMQPAMVTMPYLSGEHGVGRSAAALSRAYADIGTAKVVGQGLAETARRLKGSGKPDDFITEIKTRAAKTDGERRMFDEHVRVGTIDPSAGMEIADLVRDRSGVGGRVDTGISYLEGVAREMPRAIEAINRSVTALAAYRLAVGRGLGHEAAVRYSTDAVNNTQFNYSTTNAPKIFNHPLAKLALQFKKYGQGMYQLIGGQIGKAMRNSKEGDRVAAIKTLGLLAASHASVAGVLGLPTEPFKYLLMGANAAGLTGASWGDVENKIREGAAATFGKTGGEVFARGLPRLLNVDLARMGLDSVTSFGEPLSHKESDVKAWLFNSMAGPVAALLGDWVKGANNIAGGDFLKGAEQLVPMKGAADAIRAYRQASEGKKSGSGRETLSAYTPTETALRTLGFGSGREAESSAARSAFYAQSNALKEERTALTTAWANSKPNDKTKAMAAITKWNQGKEATQKITMKELTDKAKRLKTESGDSKLGIKTNKRDQDYLKRGLDTYNTGL